MKSYSKRCQDSWDQQMHGKLHEFCIKLLKQVKYSQNRKINL
jgi:hypothetical protein